jgi:hypothetical protein
VDADVLLEHFLHPEQHAPSSCIPCFLRAHRAWRQLGSTQHHHHAFTRLICFPIYQLGARSSPRHWASQTGLFWIRAIRVTRLGCGRSALGISESFSSSFSLGFNGTHPGYNKVVARNHQRRTYSIHQEQSRGDIGEMKIEITMRLPTRSRDS